jgi:hypothetical protein
MSKTSTRTCTTWTALRLYVRLEAATCGSLLLHWQSQLLEVSVTGRRQAVIKEAECLEWIRPG